MKMSTARGAVALAILLATAPAFAEPATTGAVRMPEDWAFAFPEGDPAVGRKVFMAMECYSCHRIHLPGVQLPADSGGIGPDLTPTYAQLPREYLAESVIKAHPAVAAPGYTATEGQAGMGNYNHFLTIQELIDLVAFLDNLPQPDGM